MASDYEQTERNRVRTRASRGTYDREVVHAILDEALICHVGFVVDGQPYVIPTIHARDGEVLYLHGSPASRALNTLGEGVRCCVTATLVDELVLARSAKQHSLNYRSAVVFGTASEITDDAEKSAALEVVVDHIARGRAQTIRGANAEEMETTFVLRMPIDEASAKIREGGPKDKPEDLENGAWAGILPVSLQPGVPLPADDMTAGAEIPEHVRNWSRPGER
jgi:nitroimidazol reductase NimA-like FMN-containing flavoprotein (pyridoxamine 5'-phosphate oxidase superfamily)